MASLVDDFDDSDDEMASPVDAKRVAASVDVDDMDAALFSSFGAKKKPDSKQPSVDVGKDSSKSTREPEVTKRQNERTPKSEPPISKPPKYNEQERDEELDDILDLLSGEGETTKKKPKEESLTRASLESSVTKPQGKPITYDKGKVQQQVNKPVQQSSKPTPTQIQFDDDDDNDLLSGLGLGDEKPARAPPKTTSSSKAPPASAPFQRFAGTKTAQQIAPPTEDKGEDAEEEIQFGGYVPSSMVDQPPSVSRRRNPRSMSTPNDPPSGRKSVRFSEQLELPSRSAPPPGVGRRKRPTSTEGEEEEEEGEEVTQPVITPRPRPGGRGRSRISNIPSSQESLSLDLRSDEFPLLDDDFPEPVPSGPQDVPQDGNKGASEANQMEHPTFPWQKSQRGSSLKTNTARGVQRVPPDLPRANNDTNGMSTARKSVVVRSDAEKSGTVKEEPEKEEVEGLLPKKPKKPQVSEEVVDKWKAECTRLEGLLSETKKELSESLEKQRVLEEDLKQQKSKVGEMEETHRKAESELKEKLEETKVNLYKVELDRNQLQEHLEGAKRRHQEEMDAFQKSLNLRLTSMEESLTRRESRWKEELEAESGRWQDRLGEAEREKKDAVLALKRKIDAMEVSKSNEISRLQSVHRSAIEDVKRDHELDQQHLIRLHHEEIEALKAAHSHTRMLAELNSKVEASTKDVGHLQAKLSDTHTKLLEERAYRNKTQEDHLRALEERLVSQQTANEAERERLQSLVAKLEAHISQQSKSVEQERWQLQQQSARLKAQQAAFQEERVGALNRTEEEREQVRMAREQFLADQQEILAKCYEEQRVVKAERAQVTLLKRKAEEREAREKMISEQLQEELAKVSEEKVGLQKQQEELQMERKALQRDREKLEAFGVEIEKRSKEVDELCKSSMEIGERGEQELLEAKQMKDDVSAKSECLKSQLAELREKEQRMAVENLSLAKQRRNGLHESGPIMSIPLRDERDGHTVREFLPPDLPDCQMSNESPLTLAELQGGSTTPHDELATFQPSLSLGKSTVLLSANQPSVFRPFLSTSMGGLHRGSTTTDAPRLSLEVTRRGSTVPDNQPPTLQVPFTASLGGHRENVPYSNSFQPSRALSLSVGSPARLVDPQIGARLRSLSIQPYLRQIENKKNMREIAAAAAKDYEELEKESEFLASLENQRIMGNIRN